MSCCCTVFLLGAIAIIGLLAKKIYYLFFYVPPIPKLDTNYWWGSNQKPAEEDTSIKPFKIKVSDEVLTDLRHRLDNARPLIPPLEGIQQQYGINTNLLKEILDFWKTKYNWREREQFLNQYPQYTTNIQGLQIHFLRVKPSETSGLKVLPLLLLHGWPGSIREFYETIPHFTKPQKGRDFVFELIIPSLPGYGFSQGTNKPGLSPAKMGVIFNNLMKRVGFDKYYVQGGDWGSVIATNMATVYPDNILGVHFNMAIVGTPKSRLMLFLGSFYPTWLVKEEHVNKVYPLSNFFKFILMELGYMHIQATKPDTVGVALNDSPTGLAAYILEKFTTWTNVEYINRDDGGLTLKYDYNKLLDNLMIYWVTNSITTSMRIYAENFNKNENKLNLHRIPVKVPSACARFGTDVGYQPDKILKEKYSLLLQASDLPTGGHFAALEEPKMFADDVWEAVEKFEAHHKKLV